MAYFKYVGILTTNDARYSREIVYRIATARATSNKRKTFHQQIGLRFMKKLINCYVWTVGLFGAENWSLRKMDQKYLSVLKCSAGEGWRSDGPIVWEMKKCYIEI